MALTLHGTVADNTAVLDRRSAKPLIINGDMQVSQRGTSFSASTSEIYTLDRFKYIDIDSTDNVYTITQDSDVPSGQGFAKSLKVDVATADASLDSLDGTLIEQRIEAQDLQHLSFGTSSAKSLTLAFWVKSNKTGTYVVRLLQSDNSSKQVSYAYTISSANTWEKKVVNIPGDTAGVITNDNGSGLQISWLLSAGAGLQSGALRSAWTAYANGDVAPGQVNLADSTSNEWYLTGVQLEVGTFDANSIAPFQHESFGDSLIRCQRYLYDPLRGTGSFGTLVLVGIFSGTFGRGILYAPVEMRTIPTIVSSGNFEIAGRTASPAVTTTSTSSRTGTQAIEIQFNASSGLDSGETGMVRRDSNDTATFRLDAEL